MLLIDYNKIIVTPDYRYYNFLRQFLIKVYLEKNVNYFTFINSANEKTKYNIPDIDLQIDALNRGLRQRAYDKCDCFYKPFYLYELDDQDNMIIPIGYLEFIKPYIVPEQMKVTYNLKEPLININNALEKINENLLPNIILRKQQIEAIKKMIILKRTIIQMGTGAGKTECMCGFIKVLSDVLGYIPTTLLLEPTDKLKKEIIARFNKYSLDAVDYNKSRIIQKGKINVSHPASLNNDLSKDNNILKDVKVYFTDECLHKKSKILLPDNKFATIEEIYNNPFINSVMSYNLDKNIYEEKKILRKIKTPFNKCFWKIEYTNPITNKIGKLYCTENHKIWTKNRGYVRCDELTKNDLIKIDVKENFKLYKCPKCGKEFKSNSGLGGCIAQHNHPNLRKNLIHKGGNFSDPEIFKKAMKSRSENIEYRRYLSERMKNNNPMKDLEIRKKVSRSIRKRRKENPEYARKCIENYIKAPRRGKGNKNTTKFERLIIDLKVPDLEYTGDGKFSIKFKTGKNKIPDFIYKKENKVIEIGDIHYWHTLEEINQVINNYKEVGYDCLYLTNEDVDKGRDYIKGKIEKFLFNHHVKIDSVKYCSCPPSQFKYNLEIEDNHNYWADGILVSNCHHQGAMSYNMTAINIPNAEYMIGVSASAVSQDHVSSKNLQDYSVEELKSIAMLGLVSYNVTAKDLIQDGKLTDPVLLVVNNLADEKLNKRKQSDWHEISRVRLQSDTRTQQIAKCASYFSKMKRKTLILINNKEWAYKIAKAVDDCGYGEECRLSFGGQIFLKYDYSTNEFIKDKETFDKFHTGEVSILIGTQHLVEGVDVPSLDCVILPAIGKSERIQIQSCGRALRLTKNGNMAYIIDFSDEKDPILNYQFKTRLSTYINTIGVKSENIHVLDRNKLDESLSIIFNKYE